MSSDGAMYGGGSLALVSIIGLIYTKLNHKRIRANCCGKQIEMELDIDSIREVAKVQPAVEEQTIEQDNEKHKGHKEYSIHPHKIDKPVQSS
jgi:hypothetical protein